MPAVEVSESHVKMLKSTEKTTSHQILHIFISETTERNWTNWTVLKSDIFVDHQCIFCIWKYLGIWKYSETYSSNPLPTFQPLLLTLKHELKFQHQSESSSRWGDNNVMRSKWTWPEWQHWINWPQKKITLEFNAYWNNKHGTGVAEGNTHSLRVKLSFVTASFH